MVQGHSQLTDARVHTCRPDWMLQWSDSHKTLVFSFLHLWLVKVVYCTACLSSTNIPLGCFVRIEDRGNGSSSISKLSKNAFGDKSLALMTNQLSPLGMIVARIFYRNIYFGLLLGWVCIDVTLCNVLYQKWSLDQELARTSASAISLIP